MKADPVRVTQYRPGGFFSRVLLLISCLGLAATAMAQQSTAISPSVVLVLKLVSSTNVKPTTGIVISDDGLVLVSADFAAVKGEAIVLDGGTDIVSNGRPATLVEGAVSGGLAVLSVAGLERPGIQLSMQSTNTDNALHFEAFPPAGDIAKGRPPLWLPLDVLNDTQTGRLSVSPETPLPYVTGAIIDACGYLAGFSLSRGAQSLETGKGAPVLFEDELKRFFSAMEITLPAVECKRPVLPAETPVQTPQTVDVTVGSSTPRDKPPAAADSQPAAPGTPGPTGNNVDSSPATGVEAQSVKQVTATPPETPSLWRGIPFWLPLLGVIVFGVFAWKGIYFFRLSKNIPVQPAMAQPADDVQPASDEPVTAPLATGEDGNVSKPRSAPVIDFEIPATGTRPEGCDGVLVVEGWLDADTAFRRFCFVNTGLINITIGRGDADIVIEHAAISRSHARVESDSNKMTLTDLGSRNGTFIGDVPCLPGEVFYFNAEDEVFLGDVKMTLRVVRQEAEWA